MRYIWKQKQESAIRDREAYNHTEMERRSFSPKYKQLLEERESETSLRSEEDAGLTGPAGSSFREAEGEYEERVVILSDGSGDADSGISLSEVAGAREDHPGSRHGGSRRLPGQLAKQESLLQLVVQIVIPFFFAGFGMMAAGLLLDAVQVSFFC